jgi:hypothetical protein
LKEIDEDLGGCFPLLKTLYMHGNHIMDMTQILRFADLHELQTLTLYGNPIEHVKNYRLVTLNTLYRTIFNLKKFDQVLITRQEYDNVMSLNTINSVRSLKALKVPQNVLDTLINKLPTSKTEGDGDKNNA